LTISVKGKSSAEAVFKSSGNDCLDKAALKYVHGHHFKPATENGAPIEATIKMEVNFQRW